MGASLISQLDPAFLAHVRRGNGFLYHVPAQALLLTAATGLVPTVLNPSDSGKDFIPLLIKASFVSGTTVIGSALIAETASVGGGPATGAPVLSGTTVAAKNAYRGGGSAKGSKMQWYPTTIVFTAAPTVISATGLNFGAADPTNSGDAHVDRLDGSLMFAPGMAMSLVYSVTSSVALYQFTIFGLELPIDT